MVYLCRKNVEFSMQENKEQSSMVQEPLQTGSYGTSARTKEGAHYASDCPCVYSDEEFKAVLQDAECGKFVTDDIVRKMFAS